MNVPRILILIALVILLINLIGWLTKPDDYRPQYRSSISLPSQFYAQQEIRQDLSALVPNQTST